MKNQDKIRIEERILALMESSNLAPWKCPWMFSNANYGFGNDTPYRGVNAVMTAMYRASMGFKSVRWFTNTKISNLNGMFWDEAKGKFVKDKSGTYETFYHIRKGARSIPVIKVNIFSKTDKATGLPLQDEDGNPVVIPTFRVYNVFNGDDVVGYDPGASEKETETIGTSPVSIESAVQFQKDILARYEGHPSVDNLGGDRAYYIPSLDEVHLPDMKQFTSWQEYASTLAHELSHSTGHERRLKRDMTGSFGTRAYSKEELVAEFSAAMILARYGVEEIPVENSAAYIKSWASRIRQEQGILYEAIQMAQRSCDLIMGTAAAEVKA